MHFSRPDDDGIPAPIEAAGTWRAIRIGPQVASGRRAGPRRKRLARTPAEEQELTRRERQILLCFAQGLGTGAIAENLSISRATVRNHSQRILAKMGSHSRIHAVAVGYASGLIPLPAFRPRSNEKESK